MHEDFLPKILILLQHDNKMILSNAHAYGGLAARVCRIW